MASLASLLQRAKAIATGDRFLGALEEPAPGAVLSSALVISGWALSRTSPVERIEAFIGGEPVGAPAYGIDRPDVARLFPTLTDGRCGFFLRTWLDSAIRGTQRVDVRVTDREGHVRLYQRKFEVHRAERADAPARLRVEDVLGIAPDSLARPLAILNWDAKLDVYESGVHQVFTPPPIANNEDPDVLPYIPGTIDIVATGTRGEARVAEAIRVARTAVVFVGAGSVETLWTAPVDAAPATRVSIVIPVHGEARHTDACLEQLQATVPADLHAEIIVVDDASTDDTPAMLARWHRVDPRVAVLRNDRNLGFGESCNRGARTATGDVLVFLNNDTLPWRGWLAPLVESLQDPRVGAVGAKLLYPDGSLQEAGGVIFSDGSGWNFGNGDANPDAPLFNHVRDVDYCSAAALATRRRLFLELGGFDKRFAPAYYEDTDYCFALRAAGYRIVYQPASVVVHAGGATAGTDERAGVKSTQARNRTVFADKWRAALADRPSPREGVTSAALHQVAVQDRSARRALVWAPRPPAFDRESGSKRVFDTICFLRDAGWAVTFVAESADGDGPYRSALQQMGVAVYAGPETATGGPGAVNAALADAPALIASGGFDLAVLHFWWIGERYLPLLRTHSPRTRVLVDSVDLHFLRQARQRYAARTSDDVLDARFASEMTRELNIYAAADGVLTVSQKEADIINDWFGRGDLAHSVPDAEDLARSPIGFNDRRGLLFLGNFRHTPNVEALGFLMREIVPRMPACVLTRHPISIVGNELTPELVGTHAANRAGVRIVGWVPSVEPYLEQARVTLLPLRHGAGTKRKLIQAAMTGTPSVSTTIGVEGLPLRDGEHVLVADDPEAFAAHIVRLVEDERLWTRLADAGRQAAVAAHGRGVVRGQLEDVIRRILA